ncbi:PREDICTED: uncharacterized protein LOC105313403 [Amphimedon queenslandica]|uniref:Lysine-specific metallo-endopeptidase domain-containing protein n=1 Tax=Amphimedon queenslandica TaxID=400682 RepID=A0A1X7UI01_AMPQE|nr:PREDICTED: uncharacterized protein LOC105313403 [Amphimedon queenslandica]|eukprot:XP_011405111.2 PREDICTED: uncharacterized protein LOC105313403 [Amphimedon queenslandica]
MKTLLSLFCLVTYLTCALSANGWPISLDMACGKALSAVACSFEFTNNANEDLYLLKRNTPLEGLNSEFVSVSLDGRPLEYEGIIMRCAPPAKDEFVLLKGGESISASVQITDIFSIDTDGLYTVQYSRPLQYLSVNEMSAMSIHQLRGSFVRESVQLYLEDTSVLSKPKIEEVKIDYTVHIEACGSASFSNGNVNNSKTLDAHKKLCAGTDRAKNKVGNITVSITWFGRYDAGRTATAKKTYTDVKSGITNNVVTYYNNGPRCGAKTYAYVLSNVKNTVYLCNLYYKSQTYCSTSAESKEGTLLHEWSHSYAGRIDYKSGGTDYYGRSKCKELAKNDPANAVKNADNYCYHYCDAQ